jgi:predicted Zn finger-like uncharacterized protein
MPIPMDCPHCDARIRASDAAAGKKIRCPKCQEVLVVPFSPDDADEPEEREERTSTAPRNRRGFEDLPRAKRDKADFRKPTSNQPVILALAGGVLVLLFMAGGVGLIWWLSRDRQASSQNGSAASNSTVPLPPPPVMKAQAGGPGLMRGPAVGRGPGNPVGGRFQPGIVPPEPEEPEVKSLPPDAPVIEMTVGQFKDALNKDPKAARARFRTSFVKLTGVINTMKMTEDNQALLRLYDKDGIRWGNCLMSDLQPWTKASIGQTAKLKGVVGKSPYFVLQDASFAAGSTITPSPSIAAEDLVKEFTVDPPGSTRKYQGQAIVLTGSVASRTMDGPNPILILKTNASIQISCRFDDWTVGGRGDVLEQMETIQEGQSVKLLCYFHPDAEWDILKKKELRLMSSNYLK